MGCNSRQMTSGAIWDQSMATQGDDEQLRTGGWGHCGQKAQVPSQRPSMAKQVIESSAVRGIITAV